MTDLWDLMRPPGWMADARCRSEDTELFYPEKGDWESSRAAIEVCRGCTVQQECLDYANTPPVEVYGVWGGMSSKQRQEVRRELRRHERARCGTVAGWRQHARESTEPCGGCVAAWVEREKRIARQLRRLDGSDAA